MPRNEGLTIAAAQKLRPWLCELLEHLASIALAAHHHDRAATLLAATTTASDAIGWRNRFPHRQARYDAAAAELASRPTTADGGPIGLEAAVEYAQRMRGPRNRPTHGWESLTPTEQAVVEHLRNGLTNAQIAGAMFISPATVKTHLEHIDAKLQLKGRVEVVAEAARRNQRCTWVSRPALSPMRTRRLDASLADRPDRTVTSDAWCSL